MIKVNSLTKFYGNVKAVDNVSFNISRGQIIGLLGHNGAGKTTIMQMLTGFFNPDLGDIFINDINIQTQKKEVQSLIGYLPENLPIYHDMNVIDYLEYCANLRNISDKKNKIKKAMQKTNISQKAFSLISSLSRGFKQRVGVAQAILHEPKILILDEPTNGLDPNQTKVMRELIKDLAKKTTIIISTHIMQEVDAICDKVLILKNGSLALNKELKDLKEANTLKIKTNMPLSKMKKILSFSDELNKLKTTKIAKKNAYEISLSNIKNKDELLAKIAKDIVSLDYDLFSLQLDEVNLENIFYETTNIS